jgi:hypothetical protein
MSQQPINLSPDLKALQEDGYEVEIVAGHLVIHNVPYVDANKQVKRGALVSKLDLAGDVATRPSTHVAMFAGEYPCDKNGRKLAKIKHQSSRQAIREGLIVEHSFSSKPPGSNGYDDYYRKMTTYIAIISSQAHAIDPSATAQTRRVVETNDPEAVFNYTDNASARAGITAVTRKLELSRIAIIGLGGTGSYVLDLVAKTPVKEIHLFDGDDFFQHNAFRSPGAPSIEELKTIPNKASYWAMRYAPMRKNILAHEFHIDESNLDHLDGMEFVFVCVDRGDVKLPIIEKLEALGIPFVDVGMGIDLAEDRLHGLIRVTTSTPEKREHVRDKKRIGLTSGDPDGIYSNNIQIADLNALNSALAVIKWKKLFGFYLDLDQEHFSAYTLDGNIIFNEDKA